MRKPCRAAQCTWNDWAGPPMDPSTPLFGAPA